MNEGGERKRRIAAWCYDARALFGALYPSGPSVYFESDGIRSEFRCFRCDWTAPGHQGGRALEHQGDHAHPPWIKPWELDEDEAAVLTDAITSWF